MQVLNGSNDAKHGVWIYSEYTRSIFTEPWTHHVGTIYIIIIITILQFSVSVQNMARHNTHKEWWDWWARSATLLHILSRQLKEYGFRSDILTVRPPIPHYTVMGTRCTEKYWGYFKQEFPLWKNQYFSKFETLLYFKHSKMLIFTINFPTNVLRGHGTQAQTWSTN